MQLKEVNQSKILKCKEKSFVSQWLDTMKKVYYKKSSSFNNKLSNRKKSKPSASHETSKGNGRYEPMRRYGASDALARSTELVVSNAKSIKI